MPTEIFLANMTWDEARDRAKESGIAILPIGSTEEHGFHIPLNSDTFHVTEVVKRAAEIVADEVKPVIAPTIPYGVGAKSIAKDFPGTLFVRIETLKELVKDVCETLALSGFRNILIVDGHGGNPPAVMQATKEITEETGAAVIYFQWGAVISRDVVKKTITTVRCHADEGETSVNLALGNRVLMEKAVDAIPNDPIWKISNKGDFEGFDSGALWFPGDLKMQTNGTGVMGVPSKATVEKGRLLVDEAVKGLASLLRDIAHMPRY